MNNPIQINSALVVSIFTVLLIGRFQCKLLDDTNKEAPDDKKDSRNNNLAGLTSAQVVRLHDYIADVHPINTQPGVRLNLVHVINPAIPNTTKNPVLFIHGIATSTTCFMVNAEGGRPRDLSHLDAANMTIDELEDLLLEDPAAKGLPFLMSNFGHDVWLLNRRATLESQLLAPLSKKFKFKKEFKKDVKNKKTFSKREIDSIENKRLDSRDQGDHPNVIKNDNKNPVKPSDHKDFISNPIKQFKQLTHETIKWALNKQLKDKAINKHYWDYSMDEQAIFDLPAVIDYILSKTGWPKLSIVAHSMGGALTLMTLSEKPAYAMKIANTALLAPAAELGFTLAKNPLSQISALGLPILTSFKGPIFPTVIEPLITTLVNIACSVKMLFNTVCQTILTGILGKGVSQLELPPGNLQSILDTTGSMEYVHLIQSIIRGRLHKFDYGSAKNKLIYGEFDSQAYDLSRIKSNTLSIWIGNTDTLIPPADARVLFRKMIVPIEKHFITGDDVEFNHVAFLFHVNVTKLLNIPLLKSLHTPLKQKFEISNDNGEDIIDDELI